MKLIKKTLYTIHRVLGTILSILFVVWFLSGFVMIYHTFPKVFPRDRYKHIDLVEVGKLNIDSIVLNQFDSDPITKLELKSKNNISYFEIATSESSYTADMYGDSISITATYNNIENYAKRWCKAEIMKVDTLRELDQWIPFGQLKKHFPIYKFYFADDAKHQLYVSSLTGDVLQFTNRSKRMWSWLGAIPHWVYFTNLRQNSQLWVDVVVWLSGIGCIMCLSGIVIGIRSYYKQYKRRKKLQTPYKKVAYKWHHILGFIFGIFVFTFTFSGLMSMASMPQWIVKTHNPDIARAVYAKPDIDVKNYNLALSKLFEAYPNRIKSIEWHSFGTIPIYKVVVDSMQLTIDASGNDVMLLALNETDIRQRLLQVHTEEIHISLMTAYDNYYVGLTDHLTLPIYKVEVADADNSTYYINPKNGTVRYYNRNSKAHRWTYQALHSFKFKFLAERPILWNIVMWTTMIGGTLVSLTGVWLSIRFVKRKIRKLLKKKNRQKC